MDVSNNQQQLDSISSCDYAYWDCLPPMLAPPSFSQELTCTRHNDVWDVFGPSLSPGLQGSSGPHPPKARPQAPRSPKPPPGSPGPSRLLHSLHQLPRPTLLASPRLFPWLFPQAPHPLRFPSDLPRCGPPPDPHPPGSHPTLQDFPRISPGLQTLPKAPLSPRP